MHVQTQVTADLVSPDVTEERFTLRRGQRVGIGALIFLLIALAVILFQNADKTVSDLSELSNEAHTMSNVILTQHESLQYASSYERWLSGTNTRDNLQVRRSELAEKLTIHDETGISIDKQVSPSYLASLRALDDYLIGTPSGLLTPDDQAILRARSDSALNTFIMQTREMVDSNLNGTTDPLATLFQREISRQNDRNAALLVALALIFLATGFIGFSHLSYLRKIRARMETERQNLDETNVALQRVENELQLRLDQERSERAEQEWLNSTFRLIALQLKGTIDPNTIAESLIRSLGRTLGVDVVVLYMFPNFPIPRLWKQWHLNVGHVAEESLVLENESNILKLAESLWKENRIITVNDSHLIDIGQSPIPKLATVAQARARSWVLVPMGAGSQVMGCLGIGYNENPHIWTSVELELIEKVVNEGVEVFTQARLFKQSMQIAENNAEVDRLIELDKVKNNFIENMNHELRTPLASIIGYLEVIMDDVDAGIEPSFVSSLMAVQRNAIRLQNLIENMMQISKRNFQEVALDISTVDIGHLLDDVVKSLHPSVMDSDVTMTLRLDSPAGDLIIDGDVNQLEQVFVNLISNAVKFTPRGGSVTVVARRFDADVDYVEVQVIDTGIGIPPEEFPNMFKRFFRASTATQASIPGFGIGLSLVNSIVREHCGTITFDSTVGKGTTFTVTLPTRYIATKLASEIT